ncbi:MAG: hypothetical protein KGP28_10735, partial [Bdellovibrionales bacterium]|nr:hypothetical protein [Bdellovibrionales bacterium]
GLTNAIAISAGAYHTCALLSDGTARCWGWNLSGQLGDGTNADRTSPVQVSGLTNAIAISAGESHTCAVLSDGMPRCWGNSGLYNHSLSFLEHSFGINEFSQVYGIDLDPGTPLTSITATSNVPADGVSYSEIQIQLTSSEGNPMVGITPTYAATNSNNQNTMGTCSPSNSIGQSTCTLSSIFAEVKRLWLTSPIRVLATASNPGEVVFLRGSQAKLTLGGLQTLKQDACSTEPLSITLTDALKNPVLATVNLNLTLNGLAPFASIFRDPLCSIPLSSPQIGPGASSALFYIKASSTNSLLLEASAGGLTLDQPYPIQVTP